jgi:hypothetical protein
MSTPKQDNSTLHQKIALRRQAIDTLEQFGVDQPVVMETHGGEGVLFNECYAHLDDGVVFELDEVKVGILAKQRPTWAVYQADCVEAIAAGAGNHLVIDLLDADPYGMSFDVLAAFFSSPREFAARMLVVVNDGGRLKTVTGSSWEVEVLKPIVREYGNDLHPIYKEVCREMLVRSSAQAGYTMTSYAAYYAGHALANTHYLAVLDRA